MKSGNLNFLEPSGPLQDRNGTALSIFYISLWIMVGQHKAYKHRNQILNFSDGLLWISDVTFLIMAPYSLVCEETALERIMPPPLR
jgi:hypothetical protein